MNKIEKNFMLDLLDLLDAVESEVLAYRYITGDVPISVLLEILDKRKSLTFPEGLSDE